MTNNIAGKNVQYFIIKNNSDDNTMFKTLSNLKAQLPKNAILFAEFNSYYQMYIVDDEGNAKPIKFPLSDSFARIQNDISETSYSLQKQIDAAYGELSYLVNSQKSYIMSNISDQITAEINEEIPRLKSYINANSNDIRNLENKISVYSYSQNSISDLESNIYSLTNKYNNLANEYSYLVNKLSILENRISSLIPDNNGDPNYSYSYSYDYSYSYSYSYSYAYL